MSLSGRLEVFGLPDVFALLSRTGKTGTLHVRREAAHGAVHLTAGAVTGGRSDVRRQALARRLVGAGLVDDAVLREAADSRWQDGLAARLAAAAGLDADTARDAATEQAVDAVFDLLLWPDGDFSFVLDEEGLDDLGARLTVDDVVEEAERRLALWHDLRETLPAGDARMALAAGDGAPPVVTADEWQLLSLVDGRRTVDQLVALAGRGTFAVVGLLGSLVDRGLLSVLAVGADDAVRTRQELLASLEPGTTASPEGATPVPRPDRQVLVSPRLPSDAAPSPTAPAGAESSPDEAQRELVMQLMAGVRQL